MYFITKCKQRQVYDNVSALVHVIYSGVSGQGSFTLPLLQIGIGHVI